MWMRRLRLGWEQGAPSGASPTVPEMTPAAAARSLGRVFDEVASEYDRNRPAYPAELVDRACAVAGIGPGDRVLEVGCGSGQLTRSLVARGLRVTGVEPGGRLLSLAAGHLREAAELELVNARFEDVRLVRGGFRAVFCASAFHWLDPDVSWSKVADALAPGGTLALIQYCGLREPSAELDLQALLQALVRIAPEAAAAWPVYRDLGGLLTGAAERRSNVSDVWAFVGSQDVARAAAARLFGDAEVSAVPAVLEHTAREITQLMSTLSFYALLSPAQRMALERELVALHESLGRPIRSGTVAVLVTAQTL